MDPGQMSRPSIDVVILSWDRADDTVAAAESVARQKEIDFSIWIVDQGSAPAELDQLRAATPRIPRAALVELGRNFGIPGGRNRGNSLGQADIIVSLDNDAELESETALARVADHFAEEPLLGALGFRILVASTGEDDRLSWVYPRQLWPRRAEPFLAGRFCGAGHALRRSALACTRAYDESLFFYWEELDLSYQLVELGYRVAYDPSIRVLHKVSPIARRSWGRDRFYFLVRNALYLQWRYFRNAPRWLAFGLGYLVKGVWNRVPGQAIHALADAIGMIRREPRIEPLGRRALDYLDAHDRRHRGRWWTRIRTEALERLPR
jgi:GT2 family glycosyltransferase